MSTRSSVCRPTQQTWGRYKLYLYLLYIDTFMYLYLDTFVQNEKYLYLDTVAMYVNFQIHLRYNVYQRFCRIYSIGELQLDREASH